MGGGSRMEGKVGQTDIVFLPERLLSFTQTSRHGSHEREEEGRGSHAKLGNVKILVGIKYI